MIPLVISRIITNIPNCCIASTDCSAIVFCCTVTDFIGDVFRRLVCTFLPYPSFLGVFTKLGSEAAVSCPVSCEASSVAESWPFVKHDNDRISKKISESHLNRFMVLSHSFDLYQLSFRCKLVKIVPFENMFHKILNYNICFLKNSNARKLIQNIYSKVMNVVCKSEMLELNWKLHGKVKEKSIHNRIVTDNWHPPYHILKAMKLVKFFSHVDNFHQHTVTCSS